MSARSRPAVAIPDTDVMTAAVRGVTRLSRAVEKVATEHQLSLSQFRVLDRLNDGVVGGRTLAEWLAVTPPSITALVDGLVKRGLVERGVDPLDRRTVTHTLTPQGEALHATVCDDIATRLRTIVGHLDDGEQAEALLGALERWNRALDQARLVERPAAAPR